jgi:large subunit ribosomal protein L26e
MVSQDCNFSCYSGASVPIPIHPSNVEVTKLKLDKDRQNMLARRDRKAIAARNVKQDVNMA